MKRIIIFALTVMLGLGVAAFATDEVQVYFGIEAGPVAVEYPAIFGLSFAINNIQGSTLSLTGDLYTVNDNLVAYSSLRTWGAELGLTLDFSWLEVIPFALGINGGLKNSLGPADYPDDLVIDSWDAHIRFFGDIASGVLILYWENAYELTKHHGDLWYSMTTVFGVEGEIPLW